MLYYLKALHHCVLKKNFMEPKKTRIIQKAFLRIFGGFFQERKNCPNQRMFPTHRMVSQNRTLKKTDSVAFTFTQRDIFNRIFSIKSMSTLLD